jgi:hypothetical protein
MTDTPDPDARHDPGSGQGRRTDRDRRAPATRYSYRDPDASTPGWRDAFARRFWLTQAGERYLHFNGFHHDGPRLVRDHDGCLIGACQYKSDAENQADFEALTRLLHREPGHDDPEAGQ